MMKFIFLIIFIMISSLISSSTSFIINSKIQSKSACSTKLFMGPVLYGAQQTRSPLVNWYLIENKIPFIQKPPRPSNHPFGQSPYLTDDDGVEIFESGFFVNFPITITITIAITITISITITNINYNYNNNDNNNSYYNPNYYYYYNYNYNYYNNFNSNYLL